MDNDKTFGKKKEKKENYLLENFKFFNECKRFNGIMKRNMNVGKGAFR